VTLSARLQRLERSLPAPRDPSTMSAAEKVNRLFDLMNTARGRAGLPPIAEECRRRALEQPETALGQLRQLFLEFREWRAANP
jgi:hypothetical protein